MAAKKAPSKRPTLAARKTARAKKAGYESAAAQAAVTRQYGLVKNEAGKWVKPDQAFLERQVSGWLGNQIGQTPVAIGGARFLVGQGEAVFTGQRSDSAKRGPGAAYNATTGQVPYSAAGYGAKGGKKKKGHAKALAEGGVLGSAGAGGAGGAALSDLTGFGGPEADVFSPYAQADTVTTNYTRAQGKAYGRGRGEGLAGETQGRPSATSATEESTVVGGGKKHPGRKATRKAKSKKSPGGRKVTPRERRTIRRAKGK